MSSYSQSIIAGLQSRNGSHITVAATVKHFIGYDLEGYIPRTDPLPRPPSSTCDTPGGCQRWNFDASPPQRDVAAYYLPPFTAAVSAGVRSAMCAYSGWLGAPACGSGVLNEELRGKLGWDGHVVSDCTAIELMGDSKWDACKPPFPPTPASCTPEPFSGHNFTRTVGETAMAALLAGTDNNCGPFYRVWLEGLVENKTVPLPLLRTAVQRIYTSAVLLGLLDPLSQQPLAALGAESIDTAEHRALALEAARASVVLLANRGALLPLSKEARLAFIGPHANASQALLSSYHGENVLVNSLTPLLAARAAGLSVTHAAGCAICDEVPPGFPNMPCQRSGDTGGIAAAVAVAAAADVAVLFLGLDQTSEAENFDRSSLALPGAQEQLALAVLAAQPRTVVVLISGGLVASPALVAAAPALLQACYGGEMGGVALVDALLGRFSPSGKLPLTMYFANFTARDIREMDLAASGGVTHAYFSGPVLFPFGAGLSYTRFTYRAAWEGGGRALTVPSAAAAGAARAAVWVENVGAREGDCTVLVIVRPCVPRAGAPRQVLVHVVKARAVQPGEARRLDFSLRGGAGAVLHDAAFLELALGGPAGDFDVEIGDVESPAVLSLSTSGAAAQ